MAHRLLAVLVATGLFRVAPSGADEWPAPEPVSFVCRGFSYVAEVFPPKSRQNPGERPLCYFYQVGYPGRAWKVDARLRWKAELTKDADNPMPYRALVSMDGHLVTMNDLTGGDPKHSVAIYSPGGKFVKSYGLREILPKEAAPFLPMSGWTREATFYFLEKPARLYIIPVGGRTGKAMEFMLADGAFRSGDLKNFPDAAKLIEAKRESNAKTEIWATSLRFSSITDVLAAKMACE